MAIKTPVTLSKEDFNNALVTLRSNVSEVSRDTGIPRHLLSHFRNYGDGLKPEQTAKLRDFFESKGIEFDAEKAPPVSGPADRVAPALSVIHPMSAIQATRYIFPVAHDVSPGALSSSLDMIAEADARLAYLLKQRAERDEGFLTDGEFTQDTVAAMQEIITLMAANYLIVRMLRGWSVFNVKDTTESVESLRDVVFTTFLQYLVDAGLIEIPEAGKTAEDAAA